LRHPDTRDTGSFGGNDAVDDCSAICSRNNQADAVAYIAALR
jgi:hypothetical protein